MAAVTRYEWHAMLSIKTYAAPILVTVAYFSVYYGLITYGLSVRMKLIKSEGESFDRYFSQNRELLASDRMQLNTLEHMSPFLWALWLHAVFQSPTTAGYAGAVYVLTRLAYPFLIGRRLGRGIRSKVFLATFTGYGVQTYLLGTVVAGLL